MCGLENYDHRGLTLGTSKAKVGILFIAHGQFMPKKTQAPAHIAIDCHIHVIRGRKVMLDYGLAVLYDVPTGALNQAVRRNLERFPDDFMFILTKQETDGLKSQTVTSSWGGRRKTPSAFTEHGVAMLSAVLRSQRAIQMSIAIVRAFVHMRELVAVHKDIAARVEKLEHGQDRTESVIEVLVDEIDGLARELKRMKVSPALPGRKIGFDL